MRFIGSVAENREAKDDMDGEHSFLDQVCEAVVSGGAVCLLGAGFAAAGKDHAGVDVPSTTDLIAEIKRAIGLEHEEVGSLSDVTDYCEDRPDLQLILRKLLLERLTLCQPSDDQRQMLGYPWRSVFTTNFDGLAEACLPADSTQVITPTSSGLVRSSSATPIYYMHGRARDMLESSVDPRLVLSERNYLRLHDDNRELYAQLQNELFAAKYIVIVGYSLRDLEVARIFMEAGQAFREKTLIITGGESTDYSLSRLKKFGAVQPIGLVGFVAALSKSSADVVGSEPYNFVNVMQNAQPANEIDAEHFIRLIITGRFEADLYQRQMIDGPLSPETYSIRRTGALDAILERPKTRSKPVYYLV